MARPEPLDPHVFGEEQTCFGCGPNNPIGWRLRFERDGDEVVTRFTPTVGYEGPPRVFHGGLQSTLADEVAGWTLVGLLDRMGFTTSLRTRFVRPMRIDREVEARGRILKRAGSIVKVGVILRQEGKLGSSSTVSYMLPDLDKAAGYLGHDVPDGWEHLFRD